MQQLRSIDIGILVAYLVCVVGLGTWLSRKSRNTEQYTVAGRSLPFWAIGLSIFGSYISSLSFLGNPGKAFDKNWNFFTFSLATPVAAIIAVLVFVPFYRRTGHVSAYAHLESRFGGWARSYGVICYLLVQMARTGSIIYLLALATEPLLGGWFTAYGWSSNDVIVGIILMTGALMTIYTMLGGMEAVIWVGMVNSLILLLGPAICVIGLLMVMPDGPGQILRIGAEHDKFSMGSFGGSLAEQTFWVVLANGIVMNLVNFSVDQGYVQRYLTAKSDRAAGQSVLLGGLMYVPVAAVFFFIGTGLFAFYHSQPDLLPTSLDVAKHPDRVLPYFIVNELPAGLAGIVIAAVFAAAMDPSLNSMATLTYCDIYQRHFRPAAGERESMWVLRLSTLGWGAICTYVTYRMIEARNILDVWWELAGIFSGGLFGLFLLGLLVRRAGSGAAAIGVVCGVFTVLWVTFSNFKGGSYWPPALADYKSPLNGLLSSVVGTLTVLIVGGLVAQFSRRSPSDSH
ncbi:MAG: sodium/solute symporter [Planctomycetaceae bacterium]|nr:sodium/solute symporter [Planctomycetaceae bacterium]